MTNHVYEIDGEDLVVARSRHEMRRLYWQTNGEYLRRDQRVRVVPPAETIMMYVDYDEMEETTADKLAERGTYYYRART